MLQVHDELVFSVDDKKDIEDICKIMEEAVPLEVPNKVDAEVEIGATLWSQKLGYILKYNV